jgi:23S rRNA (guanosine2251-2'-O)-methyltransferase
MNKKFKNIKKSKDFVEIYGLHAVKAALNNKQRKHHELIISLNNKPFFSKNIEQFVDKTTFLTNRDFIKIYGKATNHQGVMLKTTNLKQPDLKEVINKSSKKNKDVVIMLDQITDANNIGSILRSCALFNCHSLIVSKYNAPDITSSITKVATGSVEVVNYIRVTNLSQTIDKFKSNNFWVIGFDSTFNNKKNKFELPKKCLLIFGSEGKGLRRLTKKKCDQILKIPMNSTNKFGIDSLNVANACTIALYEHFKTEN